MGLSKDQISNLPIFFIIGRPRSGTTLLRILFDAHPNVLIPTECSFIGQLYRKYHKITYWDDSKMKDFFSDLQKTRFFRSNNFNTAILYNNLISKVGKIYYKEICKVVISNYISLFEKNEILLLGDKNPIYSIYFKKIFSIFEDAKFIHLVRDYRDNHVSLTNANFENPYISFTVKKWNESLKCIHNIKLQYPEKFYTIRYEDIVNNPEKYLTEICDFLNLPFYENMLNFHERKNEFIKIYPQKIFNRVHKNLFKPISTNNIGTWKNRLSKNEIIIADYIAGAYADLYGYEREKTKLNLKCIFQIIPGVSIYYFLKVIFNIAMSLPFWWQLRFIKNLHHINGRFLYKLNKKYRRTDAD